MSSNPVPRVFVVDDEHVIASTLAAILKMHGYSATFFTSPVEALAAARSTPPDLLISDVAMPGISGIDLAIQMRAQYPTCKILLFSGQAATFDLLEDARARGHDFDLLLKPVPPTELLLEVRKMVNGTAKIHPFNLPSQTVSGGVARQSIPIPVQNRELSTRSVTAARAEIRGEHNSYAELKGQASGSVSDTPKRSLGARR